MGGVGPCGRPSSYITTKGAKTDVIVGASGVDDGLTCYHNFLVNEREKNRSREDEMPYFSDKL